MGAWRYGSYHLVLSTSLESPSHSGSLRSLVRYRFEHSKINSISPRAHVLFSVSRLCNFLSRMFKPLIFFIPPEGRDTSVKLGKVCAARFYLKVKESKSDTLFQGKTITLFKDRAPHTL